MRRVALVLGLIALPALGQLVPERELELVKQLFDVGSYDKAIKRADEALGAPALTDALRVELLRLGGLSAFNLGDLPGTDERFLKLLKLNPDAVLDPFLAPPPAIKRFDQVRQDNADLLNLARQQIALKLEQQRRDEAEREKKRLADVELRVRDEERARGVLVRVVDRHSVLFDLMPFGAGQYDQGRTGWAIAFGVAEGLAVITNLAALLFRQSLFAPTSLTWFDRLTYDHSGRYTAIFNGFPRAQKDAAATSRTVANVSAGAFYLLWGVGIIDALVHHTPATVTEAREPAPPKISLELIPGGASAALTLDF